jgi:hypothetical protein
MTIVELKRAKDRRPFQPFLIRLADGREFPVAHPDAVAWDEGTRRIAYFAIRGGGVEVIDVSLAKSLTIPAPAGGGADSNGGE